MTPAPRTLSSRMPNFLIIGAAKSGTSALYEYLRQHPQIYMSPVKEPHFFACDGRPIQFNGPGYPFWEEWVTELGAYQELFSGASRELALGEASVLYLPDPEAPLRIHHHVPDVKLIAILRDPVDRAYSGFLHLVREGNEPELDFRAALGLEEARLTANWNPLFGYRSLSLYHAQLKRYLDTFSADQVRVILYEEFDEDPIGVLRSLFGFLGVDESFVPDMSIRPNVSGYHRSRLLQRAFTRGTVTRAVLRRIVPRPLRGRIRRSLKSRVIKRPMDPELRAELRATFRDEIHELQDLLQRDLSRWLG